MASPSEGLALGGAAPYRRRLACRACAFSAGVAATETAQLGRRRLDAIPDGLQLFSAALPSAARAHSACCPNAVAAQLAALHGGTRARRVLHIVDVA